MMEGSNSNHVFHGCVHGMWSHDCLKDLGKENARVPLLPTGASVTSTVQTNFGAGGAMKKVCATCLLVFVAAN